MHGKLHRRNEKSIICLWYIQKVGYPLHEKTDIFHKTRLFFE